MGLEMGEWGSGVEVEGWGWVWRLKGRRGGWAGRVGLGIAQATWKEKYRNA